MDTVDVMYRFDSRRDTGGCGDLFCCWVLGIIGNLSNILYTYMPTSYPLVIFVAIYIYLLIF